MLTDKMISVVVPCYRDEGNIRELIHRLTQTLEKITSKYEIIYINDASPDNSEAILVEIASLNPNVTVINHSRNFGLMSVFTTGMRQARGDAVILMDGDLQDPPELISDFVKKWAEGFFVVYGIRISRDESFLRKLGYMLFYNFWARISDIHIPKYSGEFSLMDRKVVDIILSLPERERFIRGLRAWVGFPQTGIEYHRPERFAGNTTQTMRSYFNWAIHATTSFSSFPLRMISFIAVAFSFVLVAFLVYNLVFFIFGGRAFQGFFTQFGLMLLIGTVNLICIAIIAEYLNVIFMEIKNRPTSIIRSILNDHKQGS